MKEYGIGIIIIGVIGAILYGLLFRNKSEVEDISMIARVEGDSLQVWVDGAYQDIFIKGVNIGATKPGYFPGELAITEEEYFSWFQMIHDMNANTVRVYTIQSPNFYNALYAFNQTQSSPLYFMQGVWINEDDIANISDVYGNDETIKNNFIEDSILAINVIHGNAVLPVQAGFASGTYVADVSSYMIGWILGIEWDPTLVVNTNTLHPDKTPLEGTYVTNTVDSSPFEIFLAEIAEAVIGYEQEEYGDMRPLSFVNWLTTDPLSHPNDPHVNEDLVSVDMEHIQAQDIYSAGLFASYHIYPYYPEFMNYSLEYSTYIDEDGTINPYKGYLEDLQAYHSMPIIVAEYGVPASRGKAHDALYLGYNQGNNSEEMQGEALINMTQDIVDSGYAGALIFSWQDEWFKRTWNTVEYDLSDRRPFWSNIQTNEQYFGLMAFEPGETQRVSYADGNLSEWSDDTAVSTNNDVDIYVKSDAKYLYILATSASFHFDENVLYIAIDTIQNQGNDTLLNTNITFENNADFIIQIDGENNSKIMVDQYYDVFQHLYSSRYTFLDELPQQHVKNTGIFDSMNLPLSYPLYLPVSDVSVPFQQYETGLFTLGNGNPESTDYNSLTDFSVNEHSVEIQIPWALLNFMDPSTKSITSDFQVGEWKSSQIIDDIYIGAFVLQNESESISVAFGNYSLSTWNIPVVHERLKQSYYMIQEYYQTID